jgi:hypothetical protein
MSRTTDPAAQSPAATSTGCCGGKGGCGCRGGAIAPPAMKLNEVPLEAMEQLARPELLARFAVGVEWLDPRIFHLSDDQVDQAFLPDAGVGRWSVRALMSHLADAEMVLLGRIRTAIALDRPIVANFDEEAFLASDLYGPGASAQSQIRAPVAGSVALLHTMRRWAIDWLGDLTESQLERSVLHPERGELTARRILAYDVWHLEHHIAICNRKVARLLGEH